MYKCFKSKQVPHLNAVFLMLMGLMSENSNHTQMLAIYSGGDPHLIVLSVKGYHI